ncbi:JmjC domain-containing protein [Kitasatospora sp. NPDC088783]|uniref:JmjC domain-containing protein n=1 Tax=Kitasatospora sp. NPDC088783 TaxID=3364077 RepID=UPI00381DE9D9
MTAQPTTSWRPAPTEAPFAWLHHVLETVNADRSSPHHLPAAVTQPEHLLAWRDLDAILTHHHLEPPQLQLARDRALLPQADYTAPLTLRPGTTRHQIRPDKLTELLDAGASLVLDAIDHLHPPLRDLATVLEAELRTDVLITAYTSRTEVQAFNSHFDDHAVLVLQVAGTKHWTLTRPTVAWPTHAVHAPAPAGPPDSTLTLHPGDVLYLPRGWWHEVAATNGPSLHLTCALTPHTTTDLLTWLATDPEHDVLRADLPHSAATADTDLAALAERIAAALDNPAVLDRYYTARDRCAPVRAATAIPAPAPTQVPAPTGTEQVRLLLPRARLSVTGQGLVLDGANRTWGISASWQSVVTALLANPVATLGDLATEAGVSVPAASEIIRSLAGSGIVATIA